MNTNSNNGTPAPRPRIRAFHNEQTGPVAHTNEHHSRPAHARPGVPVTASAAGGFQNGNNQSGQRVGGNSNNRNRRRRRTPNGRSFGAPHANTIPGAPRTENIDRNDRPQSQSARPQSPLEGASANKIRRQMRKPRSRSGLSNKGKMGDVVPPIAPGVVRVIPLGGVEEIGKNMTAVEVGDSIIIVDIGFQFKEATTPGIDYILPNAKYLEERKDKIKGLFITHGHLDHIGGIPFLVDRLGYPPVYTRQFGALMVAKRQEEFPHLKKLEINVLEDKQTVTISPDLKITSFAISHTIPDSMGLNIETPVGTIALIVDVRVDNIAGVVTDEEEEQYKRFKDKDILLLTLDSTGVEKSGWSLSEQTVVKNIEKVVRDCEGRLIIATFASQMERIIAIMEMARQFNKKVVIEGRSMKTNLEIAKQLKLIDVDKLVIPVEEIENYPPDRIVMIVTGAQGEEFSTLMRIANKTHKHLRLRPTDTILLSSSIIPTNYSAVIKLKDHLYRTDAKIITYLDSDIHASGHGSKEELRWIHNHINYKFFMPLHGYHFLLKLHGELAVEKGIPRKNVIIPDNGTIAEFYLEEGEAKMRVLKEKAPSNLVMVDGFAIGDMQEVVMRDRQSLADDGMFVVVAVMDSRSGKLRKSPDIISRGFVYLRESQDLLREARFITKRSIEDAARGTRPIDIEAVKERVIDEIGRYLFQQTAKRPMVIPVIIEV